MTIETSASGQNDLVYLTTLCQCLLLNYGEDPLWAQLGIPAIPAVQQGIAPDWYVSRIQQFFSQFFASLTIQRATDQNGNPVYNINVMTNSGVSIGAQVPY